MPFHHQELPEVQEHESESVTKYRKIRVLSRIILSEFCADISGEEMRLGGRDLGVLSRETSVDGKSIFLFPDEYSSSILFDYCIFSLFDKNNTNIPQRTLSMLSENETTERRVIINAFAKDKWGLYEIIRIVRGLGAEVRNLLDQSEHLIYDLGLADSAQPKMIIVGRIVTVDGITFTTGACGDAHSQKVRSIVNYYFPQLTQMDILDRSSFPFRSFVKEVTKAIIAAKHEESDGLLEMPTRRKQRIGVNDPCPCGSAKKYKKCCGRGLK